MRTEHCKHKGCKNQLYILMPSGEWLCWKHWEQHCDRTDKKAEEQMELGELQ